ncbi:TetR family transcriptional regulator [Streptomyces sp. NPDC001380]|uniref:TetR family transcriptional regulator n=1 Tax=Streptomyces sp. NPDC001380 TaxID=3364566 RepID=UPI0036A8345E
MGHTPGVRQARKEQTRRALMGAALRLLEHQGLSGLGLREVTREAGMSPAAFYRHFPSVEELGAALVEEAFGSLHAMLRATRAEQAGTDEVIRRSVEVTVRYVGLHRAHFRFLARERYGGVRAVREAVAAGFRLFSDELAADLAAQPESAGWAEADVRMLADLFVDLMVATAAALLEVPPGDRAAEERVADTARRRLRLIGLGRRHWLEA